VALLFPFRPFHPSFSVTPPPPLPPTLPHLPRSQAFLSVLSSLPPSPCHPSWFATKALSYSVHLRYPTGPAAEMERGMRARQVVAAAYHDMELAAGKHRVVQAEKEALTG